MKENAGHFRLALILLLLEGELCEELSILGEGKLVEDLLQDWIVLQEYLEIKDAMQLFKTG